MIPLPPTALSIDMAVNDPETGIYERRIRSIQISHPGETLIEIEPRTWGGYIITITALAGARVRLHRKTFPYRMRKCAVGNWCWDRFTFYPETRDELLTHLRDSGHWRCTVAATDFFEWFNGPEDAQP